MARAWIGAACSKPSLAIALSNSSLRPSSEKSFGVIECLSDPPNIADPGRGTSLISDRLVRLCPPTVSPLQRTNSPSGKRQAQWTHRPAVIRRNGRRTLLKPPAKPRSLPSKARWVFVHLLKVVIQIVAHALSRTLAISPRPFHHTALEVECVDVARL